MSENQVIIKIHPHKEKRVSACGTKPLLYYSNFGVLAGIEPMASVPKLNRYQIFAFTNFPDLVEAIRISH